MNKAEEKFKQHQVNTYLIDLEERYEDLKEKRINKLMLLLSAFNYYTHSQDAIETWVYNYVKAYNDGLPPEKHITMGMLNLKKKYYKPIIKESLNN